MARQYILAWPVGIVNVILYAIIFHRYGLYADQWLQVYFLILLAYGWWRWKHPGDSRAELPVTRISPGTALGLGGATACAALAIGFYLDRRTDSTVPYWDAAPTAMSLAAQYMQGRKWLENWLVWIAANLIYVGLYLYKDLRATAILYLIFIGLAVIGWRAWRHSWGAGRAEWQPAQAAGEA